MERYKKLEVDSRQAAEEIRSAERKAEDAMRGMVSAATPGGGGGGTLPFGWSEERDGTTGQTYYYNAQSQTTSWER